MIECSRVSVVYPPKSEVLKNVSFQVEKGEFVYVLGGTGAGKTSLLKLLTTENFATMGTIKIFGHDVKNMSLKNLQKLRRLMGVIPQGLKLIPDLTVQENVELGAALAGVQSNIFTVLDQLELDPKALVSSLSGGESQRVSIARAICRKPKILIADEPTGSQDRKMTWTIFEKFSELHKLGTTILLATHDQELVERIPKKCLLLQNSNVVLKDLRKNERNRYESMV